MKNKYIKNKFYPNGKLKEKIPYKNGTREGVAKKFYPNGKLESEIPYKNGKINGIAKFYNENGVLKSEIPYVNSKRHGIVKEYDENSNLKCEILYKKNRKFDFTSMSKTINDTNLNKNDSCLSQIEEFQAKNEELNEELISLIQILETQVRELKEDTYKFSSLQSDISYLKNQNELMVKHLEKVENRSKRWIDRFKFWNKPKTIKEELDSNKLFLKDRFCLNDD